MNGRLMNQIVRFGDRYKTVFLARDFPTASLEANWYGGLSLLLSHSFYQGRRDEVSEEVEKAAMPVLDAHFKNTDFATLEECDFDALSSD